MLNYDETHLVQEIEKLTPQLRVAFAAACATRLLPAYLAYSGRHEIGSPDTLRAALDATWRFAREGVLTFDPEQEFERCAALVPRDDDDECVNEGFAYAGYAAESVAYAVGVATSGNARRAMLAANCNYDVLDNHLSYELDIDFNVNRPAAIATVLGHPLMQAEFARQQRDLRELAAAGSDATAVVLRVQARAVEEARAFFGQDN